MAALERESDEAKTLSVTLDQERQHTREEIAKQVRKSTCRNFVMLTVYRLRYFTLLEWLDGGKYGVNATLCHLGPSFTALSFSIDYHLLSLPSPPIPLCSVT